MGVILWGVVGLALALATTYMFATGQWFLGVVICLIFLSLDP